MGKKPPGSTRIVFAGLQHQATRYLFHRSVGTRPLHAVGENAALGSSNSFTESGELWCMSAIVFLVFYGNYMIAPLVPALAQGFGVHATSLKWLVPGFSLLYGTATLFYGILSDRFGRYLILKILLALATATSLLFSYAMSAHQLVSLRLLSAAGTGGIATIALSIIGDHYPYAVQGRPMGQLFGAIGAGMGLGSSLGPLLSPLIGWRNEVRFISLGFALSFLWVALRYNKHEHLRTKRASLWAYALEYRSILEAPRGGRTFAFIFANGAFHGGVFAWLGVFLASRYHLSEIGIGLVLAGYGLPDLLLAAAIGSLGDRFGRRFVVPAGILWSSICGVLLALHSNPLFSALIITALSAGFAATHPLMSSITTSLDPKHRGQITGLATFANFAGMGIGALVFHRLMKPQFGIALVCFGAFEFAIGLLAAFVFRAEGPKMTEHSGLNQPKV